MVDGSQDVNIEDGQGAMYLKFYNYAGIDISALHNGSYVVATGILLKLMNGMVDIMFVRSIVIA